MIARLAIAGGALLIGTPVFTTEMAAAEPAALRPALTASARPLVDKVQWRYRRFWRHECARRWGWGDYSYRRCPVAARLLTRIGLTSRPG